VQDSSDHTILIFTSKFIRTNQRDKKNCFRLTLSQLLLSTSGYDTVDLNGRTHTGFAIAQTTSRNGSRLSTARAFLRPARNRPNLHIMLNSTATKILFDENDRAVGVEFVHDGMTKQVSVAKEVVVSGGNSTD